MVSNRNSLSYWSTKAVVVLALLLVFVIPWRGALVFDGGATIGRRIGLGVGIVWVLQKLVTREIRWPRTAPVLALAFTGWTGASVLWSINPGSSIDHATRLILSLGMFIVVWDTLDTPRRIRFGLQAYVAGASVGILNVLYVLVNNLGEDVTRVYATAFNANRLAGIIVMAIPIAWYLATEDDQSRMTVVHIVVIPFALIAVVAAGSRQAIVAAILALGLAITVSVWRRDVVSWGFGIGGLGIVMSVVGVFVYAPPELVERALSTFSFETFSQSGSFEERVTLLDLSIETIRENPLIGVGGGAFRYLTVPIIGRDLPTHNTFLGVAAELGLVGLALFLAFLAVVFLPHLRPSAIDQYSRLWFVTIGTAMPILLLNNWEVHATMWVILALAASTTQLKRHGNEQLSVQTVWSAASRRSRSKHAE